MSHDPARNQLNKYLSTQTGVPPSVTNSAGNPIGTRDAALTVGPRGPILLQDNALIDEIAHFTRERIPERVVHAKGAGAFGYFEVTHDISKYCVAGLFDSIGKRTPIAVRFSTVAGESGSADTVRDPRGFAIKFYTEEGNWDLAGNNTPIFFIRDPMIFPSFIHTQKRNPQTHLKDPDMFWDMMSLRPETTHQVLFHYSDRGIPDGYRHMNGYASHTYKMTNKDGVSVYVKFHHKTAQGIKNMDVQRAESLVLTDPDYAIRDLYNAIERKEFPQYNMFIQVMTFEQAEKFKYNPFDLTKVWPQKDYPLIPVGKLVLDRNPKNYYAEVEQIGFSPSHLVPGIDASPDKMLQARLFAYADTHRHRLGANHLLIPVNCPYRSGYKNYQRDGPMQVSDNQTGAPNYFPNSFGGPQNSEHARKVAGTFKASGDVDRYQETCDDDDYFGQPRDFWNKVLDEDHRQRLIKNLADHLKTASPFLQERAVKNFAKVDANFGRQLTEILGIGKTSNL